jgi:hypothetical protein
MRGLENTWVEIPGEGHDRVHVGTSDDRFFVMILSADLDETACPWWWNLEVFEWVEDSWFEVFKYDERQRSFHSVPKALFKRHEQLLADGPTAAIAFKEPK